MSNPPGGGMTNDNEITVGKRVRIHLSAMAAFMLIATGAGAQTIVSFDPTGSTGTFPAAPFPRLSMAKEPSPATISTRTAYRTALSEPRMDRL